MGFTVATVNMAIGSCDLVPSQTPLEPYDHSQFSALLKETDKVSLFERSVRYQDSSNSRFASLFSLSCQRLSVPMGGCSKGSSLGRLVWPTTPVYVLWRHRTYFLFPESIVHSPQNFGLASVEWRFTKRNRRCAFSMKTPPTFERQ